jgi:hypothetical protein
MLRYTAEVSWLKPVNPRLRAMILEVVENQLRDGNPPETGATLTRLMGEGHSREQAVELIAAVVVTEIYEVLKQGLPYDPVQFVAALKALPRMPWEKKKK